MSQYRLFVLAVIGLLVIGFVRMLEQPEVPDDVMGSLFRPDSVDLDPIVRAACAAVHQPLEELLQTPLDQHAIPPTEAWPGGRCAIRGIVGSNKAGGAPQEEVAALFDAMRWRKVTSRPDEATAFYRSPVTCRLLEMDPVPHAEGSAVALECGVDAVD